MPTSLNWDRVLSQRFWQIKCPVYSVLYHPITGKRINNWYWTLVLSKMVLEKYTPKSKLLSLRW